MTLAGDPDVLLLDEPTNELDPGRRRFVWSHLRALQRAGTTIVLVTHNPLEAEQVLDRVGVMRQGRVVALGATGELKKTVTGLTRVRFLRDEAISLLPYLPEQDPRSLYVEAYLAPEECRAFVTEVEIADLTDLTITSATLEDVYHGLA